MHHCGEGGKRDFLEYFHTQKSILADLRGRIWDENTTSAAAGGHLDCLRYAREHGCSWDQVTVESAARSEHLFELLKICARASVPMV